MPKKNPHDYCNDSSRVLPVEIRILSLSYSCFVGHGGVGHRGQYSVTARNAVYTWYPFPKPYDLKPKSEALNPKY